MDLNGKWFYVIEDMIVMRCAHTLDYELKHNSALSITWRNLYLIEFQTFGMCSPQ